MEDSGLKEVKVFLRSVLLSQKNGVPLNRLEADYRGMTGTHLSYRNFGCKNLIQLLEKIPDVVNVRSGICSAVADSTTKHVQALVQRQKGKSKKRGGGGGRGRGPRHAAFRGTHRGYGSQNFQPAPWGQGLNPVPQMRSVVNVVRNPAPTQMSGPYRSQFPSSRGYHAQTKVVPSGGGFRSVDSYVGGANRIVSESGNSFSVTFNPDRPPRRPRRPRDKRRSTATLRHRNEVPPRFQKSREKEEAQTAQKVPTAKDLESSGAGGTYRAAVELYAAERGLPRPQFNTVHVGRYGFVSSLKIQDQMFGSNGFHKTGSRAEETVAKSMCEELKIDLSGKKIYPTPGNEVDIKERVQRLLLKYPVGVFSNKLAQIYENEYHQTAPDGLAEAVASWPDVEAEEAAAIKGVKILRAVRPSTHKLVRSLSAQERQREVCCSLPDAGTSLEVGVTIVNGPHEIYAHPVAWEDSLNKLTTALQDTYQTRGGFTELTDLEPSTFCAALYSEDNNWYRAQVTQVNKTLEKTSVVVHYVDFGNSEETSLSSIRRLQDTLFNFPAQALKCRLDGVQKPDQPEPSVDLLYNLLTDEKAKVTINVKSLEDRSVVVEMFCSVLGSKSVNQYMREQCGQQPDAVMESSDPSTLGGVSAPPLPSAEPPPTPQPSAPPSAPPIVTTSAPPSVTISAPPSVTTSDSINTSDLVMDGAGDYVDSLDPREWLHIASECQEEFVAVSICHIDDDGSFYVQLEGRGTDRLASLTEKISADLEQAGLDVDEIDENKLYLAHSEGLWYRAALTEGPELNTVTAFFVDYGFEQKYMRPTNQLKRLEAVDSDLYHLPFQAVECQLHGLTPSDVKWTEAALDRLEELTASLSVSSTNIEFIEGVTNFDADSILTVDLVVETAETMVSVYDVLNSEKTNLFTEVGGDCASRVSPPLPDSSQYDPVQNWQLQDETGDLSLMNVSTSQDAPQAQDQSRQQPPKDSSHPVVSPRSCEPVSPLPAVNPRSTEPDLFKDPWTQFQESCAPVNSFEKLNISAIPELRSSCQADTLLQDKVLRDSTTVRTDTNNNGAHKSTTSQQQQQPSDSSSNSGAVDTSSLDAWFTIGVSSSNKPKEPSVACTPLAQSSHGSSSVKSTVQPAHGAQSVSHPQPGQAPDRPLARTTVKPATVAPSGGVAGGPSSRPVLGVSSAAASPPAQTPGLKTGDKVLVTWVSDPHNIRIIAGNMKTKLKSLMADLEDHCNQRGSAAKSPKAVKVGEMYAGMNDEDQQWYRCVVTKVIDRFQVSVQFVDRGDHNILLLPCLANLPEKFRKLPPLAMCAKLHGVKALWSEPQLRWFMDLVLEKEFYVNVYSAQSNGVFPAQSKAVLRPGSEGVCSVQNNGVSDARSDGVLRPWSEEVSSPQSEAVFHPQHRGVYSVELYTPHSCTSVNQLLRSVLPL